MRNGTPQLSSLKRTLAMLNAVIADGGQSNVSTLARAIGMPTATAHRQVKTLVSEGYLRPSMKGRHVAGHKLLNMLHHLDEKQVIAGVAAPVLDSLAMRLQTIVQLGTYENDMVTYRIKTGHGAPQLFTKVGMQLEAYCSGIGKVLLAHLPKGELTAYLANGPFVPLTENTIVEPAALAEELEAVRSQGYALDDGEISPDLICIAVPIRDQNGHVHAAISATHAQESLNGGDVTKFLPLMLETAHKIEQTAFE